MSYLLGCYCFWLKKQGRLNLGMFMVCSVLLRLDCFIFLIIFSTFSSPSPPFLQPFDSSSLLLSTHWGNRVPPRISLVPLLPLMLVVAVATGSCRGTLSTTGRGDTSPTVKSASHRNGKGGWTTTSQCVNKFNTIFLETTCRFYT